MQHSKVTLVSKEAGAARNLIEEACSYRDHGSDKGESVRLILRVLYHAREGDFHGIDHNTTLEELFAALSEAYAVGLFLPVPEKVH